MSAQSFPTQAPTVQLDRAGRYVANLVAYDLAGAALRELPATQALESVSSILLQATPDNGIELHPHPYGYAKIIIEEGFVGNEETQPDAVMTFLKAMTMERFVVEIVRNQTAWDKIRGRRTIIDSFPFGNPLPDTRKPRKAQRAS